MDSESKPRRSNRDEDLVREIKSLVEKSKARLMPIRQQWERNMDCFIGGSRFAEKADWQSDFSVNEVAAALRAGVAKFRSGFLRRPDWFELVPVSLAAQSKQQIMDKALRYQLKRANFRRAIGTFLISAAISLGVMRVGVRREKVRNPKLVLQESQKEEDEFNSSVAGEVVNPKVPNNPGIPQTPDEILASFDKDASAFASLLSGEKKKRAQIAMPEFKQRVALELTPINPFNFFYDPDCSYIEDSFFHATEDYVDLWRVKELGRRGVYKNTEKLVPYRMSQEAQLNDKRFRGIASEPAGTAFANKVKVVEYFGNVIINDTLTNVDWHVVILNDEFVAVDKVNTFWADGRGSPFVVSPIHEIPFRPSGAGMADNAVGLQRILDSNYQLTVDQMRLGLIGINIVNKGKIVDPSQLQEGITPGGFLETMDEPDKVFRHYPLTNNIENTAFPMNNILVRGIQQATGVAPIIQGQASNRSRTSAAEINAQMDGAEGLLTMGGEDLEIRALIPLLEKCLARTLQFGLDMSDEEFVSSLDEKEQAELQQMSMTDRYNQLNQFYEFEINGAVNQAARAEQSSHLTDMMKLYNQGGPLAQIVNGPEALKEWARGIGLKDPSKLILDNSELEVIFSENRILLAGHRVMVNPNDNDQLHIQEHQKVMMTGGNSPEMQEHLQEHSFSLAQKQHVQETMSQMRAQVVPPKQITSGDLNSRQTGAPLPSDN